MSITVKNNQSGFTLVEAALALAIVGILAAAVISLYHQYRVEKDWDNTEVHIELALNEIGNFRSVFGRYPCPAPRTAVPGDLDYGLEDCTVGASGACANGICTYNSIIGGETITLGTLPFKTLNLQESEAQDGYLGRLTYAVTSSLTSNTTFDMTGGGIGIVGKDGTSIITPENRGHFIVISHGPNHVGAYTKSGIEARPCADGSPTEQENCDGNATFVSGDTETTHDDRVAFFSSVRATEWQTTEDDRTDIHLKSFTNSVAVGANVTDDLDGADEITVRNIAGIPDSGTVKSNNDFQVDTLCEEDANSDVDCFQPRLLSGSLAIIPSGDPVYSSIDGSDDLYEEGGDGGLSCLTSGGNAQFMVGIGNKTKRCVNEIFLSCPNGGFINSISADGDVVCDNPPEPECPDEDVVTYCGTNERLENSDGSGSTPSGAYFSVYSGTCNMAPVYNGAYFETAVAGLDEDGIRALVDTINAEGTTAEACGPTQGHSLVRDSYQCESGIWDHHRTHEIRWRSTFSGLSVNASGSWNAESSDCSCTERYDVVEDDCPNGQAGTQYIIRKYRCPYTSSNWTTVHNDYQSCGCDPSPIPNEISCNNYYDEVNDTTGTSGLEGTVYRTYDVTCVDDVAVTNATPTTVDTDECACSTEPDDISRVQCDTGLTNSWTWSGGTETGVAELDVYEWVCPPTTPGELPDPGDHEETPSQSYTHACTCDHDLDEEVKVDCPSDQDGQLIYLKEWDCGLDDWEDESEWELIGGACNSCSWQASSGGSTLEKYAYGEPVGGKCDCGTPPVEYCHDYHSEDFYEVWTSCQCAVQID
ncbi:MAG: type II secretion system protein [Alphaproteobacteria bacterium]